MLCFNPYVCLFTAYVCRPYLINVLDDTAVDQLADWARRPERFTRSASTTALALYPAYIRGLTYLSARQGAPAAAEFQNIRDHGGLVGNHPLRVFARQGLARAFMLPGDVVKAQAEYQAVPALGGRGCRLRLLEEVRAEAR